ncbi:hypothetical protein LEP1GSC082_3636 [Leptospira kirschneri str. H2]|nr:hypothetical protein LEP1GSC082_3636 [Leptospira kirschneri str. H2]
MFMFHEMIEAVLLLSLWNFSKTFNILSASFWYRLGSKATEISLFAFVLKCFLVICVKPA